MRVLVLVFLLRVAEGSRDQIQQTIGGTYIGNDTLRTMNGPFRVDRDIVVETGATLTIQTGAELYFEPGVGIKVHGTLYAVGVRQARIKLLPFRESKAYDGYSFPNFRLVDGPSTRQGRLEVFKERKWRAVCTQNTNWTEVDFGVACRSMGFSSGGFWRWYRRNNDTRPFVMPKPACEKSDPDLWACKGFLHERRIPLSENLCQGEDDLGLVCWGPPTFLGWDIHWKGIQFIGAPFHRVWDDPEKISFKKESLSRLEYVDIFYAGYDGSSLNSTAAVRVEGMGPFINDIHIKHSARDGIEVIEPDGPVTIANSTIEFNRGRGVVVRDTVDGRVYLNETRIINNYGDGVWYRQRGRSSLHIVPYTSSRARRQAEYYEEAPLVDFCQKHEVERNIPFPYFVQAFLHNRTEILAGKQLPCYLTFDLPRRLDYTFTFQFVDFVNRNPAYLGVPLADLLICYENRGLCGQELYRIPIYHGVLPQSVSMLNTGQKLLVGLDYQLQPEKAALYGLDPDRVVGDVNVQLKIHATAGNAIFYGLNVSNSRIEGNVGRGVWAGNVRDRVVLNNASIVRNQMEGVVIKDGAADLWLNATHLDFNMRDGLNVSYAGGSVMVNGTTLSGNWMRGAAFHHNDTPPFLPLRQEIVFRGRQSNLQSFTRTVVEGNRWGGILVGNFCANAILRVGSPKMILNYVEFYENEYRPAFEFFSCQRPDQPVHHVDVAGCRFERNRGIGLRFQPAINIRLDMTDNRVLEGARSALIIRNKEHPELRELPATVLLTMNQFKFNRGPFILNVGLNEDAPLQKMTLDTQNEIKENTVFNPYPYLKARNRPFAAVVVSSSSNVKLSGNCFKNPRAQYEIATDLTEHAKVIHAEQNSWGTADEREFLPRIFDQYNRFNLAAFSLNPFAQVCNAQLPRSKVIQPYIRSFQNASDAYQLGGIIYENVDLRAGFYTVTDDLHIIPGAKLNLQPGVTLAFQDSIGMLVQGELVNSGKYFDPTSPKITFTIAKSRLPTVDGIRLVDEQGSTEVTAGRLEVKVDGIWGTICNRSWTVDLAGMACHQLGLVLDPEYLENWVTYPEPGSLPLIMDNLRCEEGEWDIRDCWHDGANHSLTSSCSSFDVVGLRCVNPHWAGVRYSLLANPPLATGSKSMSNWVIEKAGLFDYSLPEFSAALQIDWNYHYFEGITIQDSFWNGLDVVYNDLTRKPSIVNSQFIRNRRHGIRLRSAGLTIRNAVIADNENAGVRYNPIVSARLQQDVVTWLVRPELASYQFNNVIDVSDASTIDLDESSYSRKFLIAMPSEWCGVQPHTDCRKTINVLSTGYIGVQVVNRPSNVSDENMLFQGGPDLWDLRKDLIRFPMVIQSNRLSIQYSRFKGPPAVVLLFFYLSRVEYIDRFVHIHDSEIAGNQYGVSTLHYSNFTHWDGSHINRWSEEKLWFQKVNFTRNKQAVLWVNGPLRDVSTISPLSTITYFVDNCSLTLNNGSIIETHRDLYSTANIFHWEVWSSTFRGNVESGISVMLPDPYDLLAQESHQFKVSESRFYNNRGFRFELSGFFAKVNISSNNFTENFARDGEGLMLIRGMEKELVMERNRWLLNNGHWIIKYDIQSQSVVQTDELQAHISYNYFEQNRYLDDPDNFVFTYPRSFALGLFGLQKVNVSYNRFNNFLMDFECVTGLRGSTLLDTANITYNWWGPIAQGAIPQRIFDFDDWNIYILANYNPYYVSNEMFIDWWWRPQTAQTDIITYLDPPVDDLKGRMFQSKTMSRNIEKWPTFPHYNKPEVPYRITKDLTIMPGATLTIEKGVEVHIYPNVRILVLGSLVADGTFYEPIRFRPINVSEYEHRTEFFLAREAMKLNDDQGRKKRDIIYREFPLLNRQDGFYQKFKVHLVGAKSQRSGFLEIWNATTGEMVPICDRQFTRRNAEVVCRELGFPGRNAYVWIGPRYDYDPRIRIIKSYSEPRQCFGNERSLSECDLRLNGDRDLWYCSSSLRFVFVHCGPRTALDPRYVGHWGGIVFSSSAMEQNNKITPEASLLRHVEIVGAGHAHNDTSSSLEMVFRSPNLDHVNVTNSSYDGVQILAPRDKVNLASLNVTDNRGIGLNILTLNLQSSRLSTGSPLKNLTIPYHLYGMLDVCSVGKSVKVAQKLLLYYKYDSFPVDCVKLFTTDRGRSLGFRLLQAHFYNAHDPSGRPDALRLYNAAHFSKENLLGEYGANTSELVKSYQSIDTFLGIHLRANAADGSYGFLAEVAALPTAPDPAPVNEITVRSSRFVRNDRGALKLGTAGERSPTIIVDSCFFGRNGYNVWGNFSTSEMAVAMDLHNTEEIRFIGNMLWKNQGGLSIQSQSSTPTARLQGLIKNCAFAQNEIFETLRLVGKDFQKIYVVNNYFGKNRARYRDIVLVERIITNFTHNTFYNNTGTHTVDLTGYPDITTETQTFLNNFLYDNIALGHGYQFPERYGYLPPIPTIDPYVSRRKRTARRNRRQSTSFDWWANVGSDTERYRSTVLAGSSQQFYHRNFFSNPLNDFELTTVNRTEYSTAEIDGRENYWGFPGTTGVAAGKIRDAEDYNYLVKVNYLPVLQSNTSLLEGNCPGGWFQAGVDRFKTCFLFVGAAMPFNDAAQFCEEQGGFIPYFRSSDSRLEEVAANVRSILSQYILSLETYSPYQPTRMANVWVTGVKIPGNKCGFLSSVSSTIEEYNCGLLLPFVCEKGGKAYQQPFLWTPAGITSLVAGIILFLLVLLLIFGWWYKSKQRKAEHFERKNSLRLSIRSNKLERLKQEDQNKLADFSGVRPASPDLIAQAHRNLVVGRNTPTSTPTKIGSSTSFSTSYSDCSSSVPDKKDSTYYSESAYRSDYSPTEESIYSTPNNATQSSRHHVSGAPTPPLHSAPKKDLLHTFKLPSSVVFRNGKGKNKGRRHDTSTTITSDTTSRTCSTCPTTSYEDSVRPSDSTFSGDTLEEDDTSTVRSSQLSDDTVNYANTRKPDILSGNQTLLENSRDYRQLPMTPVKSNDWDKAAGGYSAPNSSSKQKSPNYSSPPVKEDSPRAQAYMNWAPIRGKRPAKPPPPLPITTNRSVPDIAFQASNTRVTDNYQLESNSKSTNNLDQEAPDGRRVWRPPSYLPDLSTFSLTPSPSGSKPPAPPRSTPKKKKSATEAYTPLETAM